MMMGIKGVAIATVVLFACPAPAWAEVCDKIEPGTFNPLSALLLGLLLLVWLVGVAERRSWLSLPAALPFVAGGWLHLAERFALARGDDDPSLAILRAAIEEGCRTAGTGPGWLMLGTGVVLATIALVDRWRS